MGKASKGHNLFDLTDEQMQQFNQNYVRIVEEDDKKHKAITSKNSAPKTKTNPQAITL